MSAKLTDRSADGSPQIVFYTSGISSQPDNSSVYNLMTGNSIKSQIIDQYTNICANFDFKAAMEGYPDRVYLFGFSRGAMAIRALAGLIAEFGLLHPRDIRHLPIILDRWDRTQGRGSVPDQVKLFPVEIEIVGLFDSVMGGIEGLSLFNPIRFKNNMIPGRCKNAVQIIAIDENQQFFKHKPWEGYLEPRTAAGRRGPERYLRQIWMPGVHSDVGGTADPVWGRASLLAMTYYLDKLTQLRLDAQWISEKGRTFALVSMTANCSSGLTKGLSRATRASRQATMPVGRGAIPSPTGFRISPSRARFGSTGGNAFSIAGSMDWRSMLILRHISSQF